MRVRRERRVRGFVIPTKFVADHIEECTGAYVLTLHPSRHDIRRDQPPADGDVTRVADQKGGTAQRSNPDDWTVRPTRPISRFWTWTACRFHL